VFLRQLGSSPVLGRRDRREDRRQGVSAGGRGARQRADARVIRERLHGVLARPRDREIDALLERIAAYPEWEREQKIKAFDAYTKHYRYVGEQAFELGNDYFARRCAIELVFFAARLALAHNRVLFPCHKSLFAALDRCDDLPPDFVDSSRRLLEGPSLPEIVNYYDRVSDYFSQYDHPDQERVSFILENEWSWFSGLPFAGDL